MDRRRSFATIVVAIASALSVVGCSATTAPNPSPAPVASMPAATPAATPPLTGEATPSAEPTTEPTIAPNATEPLTEEFPRDLFSDPTTVDNRFFPLVPGMQSISVGEVNVDEDRVDHHVVFTVTDLTKVIDGITAVVIVEQDYREDELVEAELAFFAQDDGGTVWLLGEYPEEYEEGVFVDAPSWLAGMNDAKAGILMHAEPRYGDRSYSEGWGPEVGWTDRGRVLETNSRTCVPTGCYDGVLVIDEFNRDEPDAHQLKYYAPGIGGVRVGWAGALEADQEELALVSVTMLDAADQATVRRTALALEAHGYEVSPDLYGLTAPAEPRG
jgi:hypothetical protein